MPKHTNIVPIL